jgi:hypothetical protein
MTKLVITNFTLQRMDFDKFVNLCREFHPENTYFPGLSRYNVIFLVILAIRYNESHLYYDAL